MISNHRNFCHVLGIVLAFSASTLSFSSDAQGVRPKPTLNPQEFSAVAIPGNFGVTEHITWGARALVNHSDLKEIVPVFGYRSSDVCNPDVFNLSDHKPGALLLDLDIDKPESGSAFWLNSLEDFCKQEQNHSNDYIWNTADNANPSAWEYAAAQIGSDLLKGSPPSVDRTAQPEKFIVTIGHLPGVMEVGSYWWRCNIETPPTEDDTACYFALSDSPYMQHRNLLR